MNDLGDIVPLPVQTKSAAGVLEADSSVVITVTLPDGTTSTPAVTNPSTGNYQANYVTTLAGRHTWRAVTATHGTHSDTFDVDEAAPSGIVSLDDVRSRLNMLSTASDEEIRFYIDSATDYIEGIIGPVVQRTIIETVTPASGRLFLSAPVIEVTSLAGAYGYTGSYTVNSFTVDGQSLVANYGTSTYAWPVTVTYIGGRAVVPTLIRDAALDYVKWAWESQRGASGAPFQGAEGEYPDLPTATPPYKIQQKLQRYVVPVVA